MPEGRQSDEHKLIHSVESSVQSLRPVNVSVNQCQLFKDVSKSASASLVMEGSVEVNWIGHRLVCGERSDESFLIKSESSLHSGNEGKDNEDNKDCFHYNYKGC